MKSLLNLAVVAALLAAPAFAADQDGGRTFTKGSKSYQTRSWNKQSQPDVIANTQQQSMGDVAKIEPAAGAEAPSETSAQPQEQQGKTLREEMRLPRKH